MTDKLQKISPGLLKKCRVCGDKASSFNFCGLSCESCKSFFRRNVSKEQDLPNCPRTDTCEITVKNRKTCPKCRLARCFAIGMKKEQSPKRKNCEIASEAEELNMIKTQVIYSFNILTNSLFSTTGSANQSPYTPLTSYEKTRIEEVSHYYKEFKEENAIKIVLEAPSHEEWVGLCDEYAQHIVRSAKNIPALKKYNMEDKMIMVRNFTTIFIDMRYVFYYNLEEHYGLFQDCNRQDVCFKAPITMWSDFVTPDHIEIWKHFLKRNKSILMGDPILRNLVTTISLFRQHDKISCPEMLRLHYLEYYYLLTRYLQVKLKSREKFEKQMKLFNMILGEFRQMQEYSRQFFQLIQPYYTVKLMAEIYEE